MSITPLVSVILATYQQREFIEDAINSVLGQSYPNIELIIVDTGSTDGTRDVLAGYATRPNVHLLLDWTNTSVTKPLNAAIRQASGEYISILYGDDFYLPEKLARQVRLFEGLTEEYGIVYSAGYCLNVDTGQRWLESRVGRSGHLLRHLLTGGSINSTSPLIRRACFEMHPFREDLFMEGEAIFLRFAMTHLFLYDREPVVVMRQHHRNMGLAVAKNAEIALATFAFLERQPAFPAALRPVVARARADTLQRLGWWAVRIAEDPPRARDAFARTVAIDPRRSFHPRVLAGRLLSHLSSGQLHRMNRSINTIRRHRGHLDYRRDYFS